MCRGLRWYFGTPEYNKEFTRIPSKRIIIRCMTLLDYFHIVHVYWCWWEDSWEQEDPLYIFHNVARIYKKNKFIYFKMCPGRWSIYCTYIYRKCWWFPLPHPPYWFKVTGHAVNQAKGCCVLTERVLYTHWKGVVVIFLTFQSRFTILIVVCCAMLNNKLQLIPLTPICLFISTQ